LWQEEISTGVSIQRACSDGSGTLSYLFNLRDPQHVVRPKELTNFHIVISDREKMANRDPQVQYRIPNELRPAFNTDFQINAAKKHSKMSSKPLLD
jgi:hypothetical protein